MLDSPESSLSSQSDDWASAKASYRFFDNKKTNFVDIAGPHWDNTRRACRGKRCLLISDTTEISYTRHPATEGLGMIGNRKGKGVQLHSCLAYDVDSEEIVGVAGARVNYRVRVPKNETRTQRAARWKESDVWGSIVDRVGVPDERTQYIHVFDRAGDNFEAVYRAHQKDCDWVVRSQHLNRRVRMASGKIVSLKEAIEEANELGSYVLHLRHRPHSKSREALLKVYSISVDFLAPKLQSPWLKERQIESIQQNIVIVEEQNPPKGAQPVYWVLQTSLPAQQFDDAWNVIDYYEKRWLIEEYHKALKTGCQVEAYALRTAERLESAIGMTSVIAVRLLSLKLIGRNKTKTLAKGKVPRSWLRMIVAHNQKLNQSELTVYEFFRELAKLGGFNARKSDGEPGWQTVWKGLQRLTWMINGIRKERKRYG